MANSRVAARYAKSLLDLANERNMLDEVYKDMLYFQQVSKQNRDLLLMLRNPIINHDKKKAVLYAIFQGKVTASTLAVFDIITRKNREKVLPELAESFVIQYRQYKGIDKATVTTPFPLTDSMRAEFMRMITTKTGRKVDLEEKVDPELIGGFVLKIGDQQMDNSVKGKLSALRYEFSDESYTKAI
ncbi:MAG: ATP synthase F1 subunit delta [Cyclobacteriaceae bacterium]